MNFKEYLGNKIRVRRKERKFKTQQMLCDAIRKLDPNIDIDQSRISHWEKGDNVPKKHIPLLCKALDVDESFFEEIEPQQKKEKSKTVAEMTESDFANIVAKAARDVANEASAKEGKTPIQEITSQEQELLDRFRAFGRQVDRDTVLEIIRQHKEAATQSRTRKRR